MVNLTKVILGIAASAFLLLAATPSQACMPRPVSSVSDYLNGSKDKPVVFMGTVTSVGAIVLGKEFEITLDVMEWFVGQERRRVKVRGFLSRGPLFGTDCNGMSDFSARIGERWIIFGSDSQKLLVWPERWVSIRVFPGVTPHSLLEVLRKWPVPEQYAQWTEAKLPKARAIAGISFPAGTVIGGYHPAVPATAVAPSPVSYCGHTFPRGSEFRFGSEGQALTGHDNVVVDQPEKFPKFTVPAGTNVVYRKCVIDRLWVPQEDYRREVQPGADFGYVQLNFGWIRLHPNGHVSHAFSPERVDVRGISAKGKLTFSQQGKLRQFVSPFPQVVNGIPLAGWYTELDESGDPTNFVLAKPHRIGGKFFEAGERISVDFDGNATVVRPTIREVRTGLGWLLLIMTVLVGARTYRLVSSSTSSRDPAREGRTFTPYDLRSPSIHKRPSDRP